MKKLSLFDLLTMAIGSIIGSGIFAMVGIGIGMTGKSVSIALVIGCVLNLIMCVPFVFAAGVSEIKGGSYGAAKLLVGPKTAGLMGVFQIMTNFIISIYCIAIIDYAAELIPFFGEHSSLFAALLLIIFFLVTLSGTKGMARVQGVIVVLLILSLFVFIGFGIGDVQPDFFTGPDFISEGPIGLLLSIAVLTFASMGGNTLINFYEVTENPRKNFPLALIISTVVVAIVYFLVGIVAAGVLPITETADQTLAVVAKQILPAPVYIMFIIGGAMLALSSTLNNMLAYIRYPAMALAEDGLFPKALLKTNKKDYPYILMLILLVIGLVPIVTGLDIEEIVSIVFGPVYLLTSWVSLQSMNLPKKYPEAWAQSPFKVPNWLLVVLSVLPAFFCLALGVILMANLSVTLLGASVVFVIASIIYINLVRIEAKKHVLHLDQSLS